MKNLLVAPIVVATLAASGFALAGGQDDVQAPAAISHVSVGFDGGYSWGRAIPAQVGVLQGNPFNKTSATENHGVYGGHVGYQYTVMPKLAVGAEVGYLHLAQTDVKAQDPIITANSYDYAIKQQMITFLATAHYDVFNGFGAFVKAGGAYVMQDDNFKYFDTPAVQDRTLSVDKKIHAVRPLVGAGVDYNFDNVVVGVSYEHLFGATPSSKDVADNNFVIKNADKKVYGANMVLGSIGYQLPL